MRSDSPPLRPGWALALAAALLVAFAFRRAPDHDESQYVAAAVLTAHGLLPYRDFAYLQAPLQPLVLAPLAWALGSWTWPGLRIVNALFGALALGGVYRAGRTVGAAPRIAMAAGLLLGCCDALLFSAATARNDALPVALLAWALTPALRLANGSGRRRDALLAGLLLSTAAAAKLSYALPALAFGAWTLAAPRRRQAGWVAAGALPALVLTAILAWSAPGAFAFDVFAFPIRAPLQYYRDRPAKLSLVGKLLDVAKFLALGPALIAGAAWRRRRGDPAARLLDLLIAAGLTAALLPTPSWRQYLLPMLAPLFVRLALDWQARPPSRGLRIATAVLVGAGLAPALLDRGGYREVLRQGNAIREVMNRAHVSAPIVTLSPQFLPATGRLPDPRVATGPFYFRSADLLTPAAERQFRFVGQATAIRLTPSPVLTGGEGPWTAGDARLDATLARAARRQGYRPVAVPGGRFVLWLPPSTAS